MPAWEAGPAGSGSAGRYLGLEAVAVYPDNEEARGAPAVTGSYLPISVETGARLAVMDATGLTNWRTVGVGVRADSAL